MQVEAGGGTREQQPVLLNQKAGIVRCRLFDSGHFYGTAWLARILFAADAAAIYPKRQRWF